MKPTTIYDIAKTLNLTASTVSRALSGNPRISEKTRLLVRQTAESLNYQPNNIASQLRLNRTNTIGVVVPRISRQFFAKIIHAIETNATQAGLSTVICQSNEREEDEISNIKALIRNRVDGVLISLSASTRSNTHLLSLIESRIPLVQFDRVDTSLPASQVVNDDLSGAFDVVTHLGAQGYQRIAMLNGPNFLYNYNNREAGYRQAIEELGLPFREDWLLREVLTQEDGYQAIEHLLELPEPPDAVFAASDFSGLGALMYLQDRGISVPNEFGVAGYANEPFTGWLNPSFTSVEQFPETIGDVASKLLIQQIQSGKAKNRPMLHKVVPQLVSRQSTNRLGLDIPKENELISRAEAQVTTESALVKG